MKQPSADTVEPVSNDSPPVDTVDSYKTINSDSPSNSSKLIRPKWINLTSSRS